MRVFRFVNNGTEEVHYISARDEFHAKQLFSDSDRMTLEEDVEFKEIPEKDQKKVYFYCQDTGENVPLLNLISERHYGFIGGSE